MAIRMSEALFLAGIAVVVVIILAVVFSQGGTSAAAFCAGPYNLQLYDYPYLYPKFEAPAALSWDGDRRCAAYCAQSPCTLWCR